MSIVTQVAQYLPSVKKPDRNLSFKEKLTWTGVVLLLYYVLGVIYIAGASPAQIAQFQTLQTVLGAQIGTLITLGIGPIVSASIILQLLVGSDIIPWNLNNSEDKAKFQDTQKILAYSFAIFEAFAFVAMGAIKPMEGGGIGIFLLVVAQVALGGSLLILMDEIVSKWGFHSGVSLFILAGVSQTIMIRLISPIASGARGFEALWFNAGSAPAGAFLQILTQQASASTIVGMIFTVLVFIIAVYAQSMRVEIPLTFGNVRGFGRKWPLKFVYTNVIPVIFVSAIISNFQLWSSVMSNRGLSLAVNLPWMRDPFYLVGQYSAQVGAAPNQLIYYFTAPTNLPQLVWTMQLTPDLIVQTLTYTTFYVVASAIFSVFWMKTSGQDPSSVADQILNTGMKVPGFRKDKRVIVKILNRYIPPLSVLGGAFIGFLAAVANFTNSFGTGTGILLAVMIAFQFYEEVVKKHMEEMHPALRNFMQDM